MLGQILLNTEEYWFLTQTERREAGQSDASKSVPLTEANEK